MSTRALVSEYRFLILSLVCIAVAAVFTGCAGRPSALPNRDPALRKTSAQFAADAAKRHPYKADLPRAGKAEARAQVGYVMDQIDLVNLSADEWTDVEIWIDQTYVVHVPSIKPKDLKVLPFRMFYDASGNTFPTKNTKRFIKTLEVVHGGQAYEIPLQLSD